MEIVRKQSTGLCTYDFHSLVEKHHNTTSSREFVINLSRWNNIYLSINKDTNLLLYYNLLYLDHMILICLMFKFNIKILI